ncbi:MAG: hypothetical protein L0191_07705 [Acidobacteria bacterium]|nr:hypothetical protein [Acidobacteriota bacterium]
MSAPQPRRYDASGPWNLLAGSRFASRLVTRAAARRRSISRPHEMEPKSFPIESRIGDSVVVLQAGAASVAEPVVGHPLRPMMSPGERP